MTSPSTTAKAARGVPWTLLCGLILAAGLGGWATGLAGADADRAWRALLINFVFFTPLAAGMATWPAIVHLSRGRWLGPLRATGLSAWAFAPVSLAAFAALWAGREHWASWLREAHLHNAAWLNAPALFGRDLGALLIFWTLAAAYAALARRGRLVKSLAGTLVLAYALTFSLLGMDLVMALDPHWYSTLFAWYFMISGLYAGAAGWTLVSLLARPAIDLRQRRDLGTLIVAFSLLTTYMMYSQLLPIWYENLPEEVRFVIPRLKDAPWPFVSAGLLAVVYLGPLVLLLPRRAKQIPAVLGGVAALAMVGLWGERWWLVTPTLGGPLVIGWPEVSLTGAFAAAWVLCLRWALRRATPAMEQEPAA
ncbi:MAG: hypothetical protein NTV86_05630 [Planctomycetota bacterium]|nr:hypothetical protein [Planctomycetota bacterium]